MVLLFQVWIGLCFFIYFFYFMMLIEQNFIVEFIIIMCCIFDFFSSFLVGFFFSLNVEGFQCILDVKVELIKYIFCLFLGVVVIIGFVGG